MALYDTVSGMSRTEHNCYATDKGIEVFREINEILSNTGWAERERRAKELSDAYDLDFLGAGVSRAAYRAENKKLIEGGEECVVKIAQDDTIWQNKRETLNWILIEEFADFEVAKHFTPVIDFDKTDFTWITMPFAGEGISFSDSNRLESKLQGTLFETGDMGMGNMGKINGVPVVVDYGLDFEELIISAGADEGELYMWERNNQRKYKNNNITAEDEIEMFREKMPKIREWLKMARAI